MLTTHFFKCFALIAAALFLLIVAALFHQEHLYLMAATLFLIPVVAYLIGRLLMRGIICERAAPASCSVGQRVTVMLSLTSTGSLPKFYLRAEDRLSRWLHLVGDAPPVVLQLMPGESTTLQYTLEADKRGVYALGPTQVVTTDPLGFYTYTQAIPCETELVVYPVALPVRELDVEGAGAWGRQYQDEGETHGSGLDFYGVREYRQGDELRRVHWRTTARTGKLAVMEYTQGFTSDVLLVLDLNREIYEGTGDGPDGALECAVTIAATAASHLLHEGYGVRLMTPETISDPLALRGIEEIPRALDALAHVEANSPMTLAQVLLASQPQALEGMVLIYITPSQSVEVSEALGRYETLGISLLGYILDADSFRPGAPTNRESTYNNGRNPKFAAANARIVRRGDDLRTVIEGSHYAGL